MTETTTRPDVRPVTTNGDHDAYAHIVLKDQSLAAMVEGFEVVALCGKRWIPCRNPDGLTVCPECVAIAERLGPTEALRRLNEMNRGEVAP